MAFLRSILGWWHFAINDPTHTPNGNFSRHLRCLDPCHMCHIMIINSLDLMCALLPSLAAWGDQWWWTWLFWDYLITAMIAISLDLTFCAIINKSPHQARHIATICINFPTLASRWSDPPWPGGGQDQDINPPTMTVSITWPTRLASAWSSPSLNQDARHQGIYDAGNLARRQKARHGWEKGSNKRY